VLFRKRRKAPAGHSRGGESSGWRSMEPETILITYDMMEKGAEVVRSGRKVKQIAVMVSTNVVLVTSGDQVDRPVYEALVASGAVRAPETAANETPEEKNRKSKKPPRKKKD
jgi:hypothetical protein